MKRYKIVVQSVTQYRDPLHTNNSFIHILVVFQPKSQRGTQNESGLQTPDTDLIQVGTIVGDCTLS